MDLRITYLYLQNFIYSKSGMEKDSITIDLRDNENEINVLIGKMGSGKTFILGHLQPFSNFGTIDVRNQQDAIAPEVDGLKIIDYKRDNDDIHIRHVYTWNNSSKSHSVKSFFSVNDEELNSSGNVSSFKYVVEKELGLIPAYMTLMRIGSNVTNFLDLSVTERKNYIAMLLQDANFILLLHKKWQEELRGYESQLTVVNNKLAKYGVNQESELYQKIDDYNDDIRELDSKIDSYQAKIHSLEAELNAITDLPFDQYQKLFETMTDAYIELREQRDAIETELLQLKDCGDVMSINSKIAVNNEKMSNNSDRLSSLEDEYVENDNLLNQLEEKKLIIFNDEHIQSMKNQYTELKKHVDSLWSDIGSFRCDRSSSYVKALIADLQTFDMLLADLAQYDAVMLKKIFYSDASIIKFAQNQTDMLTGRRVNLQKKKSNVEFSADYRPIATMYTPPMCPTDNCPYRRTHPYTISDGKNKHEISAQLREIQNEIERVDKEMYVYADYPVVYSKMAAVKERFYPFAKVLKELGCLKTDNLLLLITRIDYRRWYSYNELIEIQEKCIKREEYYDLIDRLHGIEAELNTFNAQDIQSLDKQIEETTQKKESQLNEINTLSVENRTLTADNDELIQIYHKLLDAAISKEKLKDMNYQLDSMSKELSKMQKNIDKFLPNKVAIDGCKLELSNAISKRKEKWDSLNALKAVVADIKFTQQEREGILKEQKFLTLMTNATSAKTGIPFDLVKVFLSGCKDIVNDLIFDIIEDDIELEEFVLSDSEFYIPYTKNGEYIKDASQASQGQKSILSIAISFALMQLAHIPYNIPLLDEVDGPLYKTDKNKFLMMLLKQKARIMSRQIFLTTHSALDNIPVNFICTTDEDVSTHNGSVKIRVS